MPPSAVVVGAGVLGSALADRLARSSWDVTHVEQYAPGHVRSGSGDESRLIRCAHGDDALHAQMSRRALELWRELDPRAGRRRPASRGSRGAPTAGRPTASGC